MASFGCKVSRIDALALGASLHESGSRQTDDAADANVLLVHTCTVTDRADRDDRKLIRRLRRENPLATLVVSGCLAQRDPDALARMPEVDLVIGFGARQPLPDLLALREAGLLPGKIVSPELSPDLPFTGGPGGLRVELDPARTRAFLKVQDGCERRCAFCVVPFVRGVERSASLGEVEETVHDLGARGVAEVVLAGVHLASFGNGRGESLLALLERLEERPPRCRVRLSSLEPMEAGGALVARVAASSVFVPHLHLPLQSGSARVLSRMRRGITPRRFSDLVARAAGANPRLHLATDVIVGFPGETDEEFAETAAFLEELPLASLHVFPFSPRSGTRAAELNAETPVARALVTERAAALRALGERKSAAFAERSAGTLADVVVLRGSRALTDHYLDLPLRPADAAPPGTRLVARLVPSSDGLTAVPVESPAPNGPRTREVRHVRSQ